MTSALLSQQQLTYQQQLTEKTNRLRTLMLPFSAPEIAVFPSSPQHYRMRAEFRIWHDGDDLYHIMFDPHTKQRLRVDQFQAACPLINRMMELLISFIRTRPTLRHRLFQVDYLSTQSGQIAISLLYHRQLDDHWRPEAIKLREHLQMDAAVVQLIGRAAKLKICLEQDFVDETLVVDGQKIIYRQVENSFTQPNAEINVKMLEWALAITRDSTGDLLELFCGNGNFTLALARNFRRVLATEIAKSSVAAAQFNIAVNGINNVQIIRMSVEDFTQAVQGVREFHRLKEVNLQDYDCETILVDPPRCGLDAQTLHLVKNYRRILYISCNPETLCGNLAVLSETHKISRIALFDQFPHTHHLECGILLEQR